MAKKIEKKVEGSYGAEDISVLEGLEPVRRRPGMYIGSTGSTGLHHLIWEIFDNSRDEAMGGYADRIEVIVMPNDTIRVADNGRGIPVDIHPKTKVSALETVMTTLHAGGKFGGEGYKVSGGLHGVGASVVNALSTKTIVEVHRQGGVYMQEYSIGKKKYDTKKTGKSDKTGTIVTFTPDGEIFKEGTTFDWALIVSHLRQQAYLVKGLMINIIDARNMDEKKLTKALESGYWLKDSMSELSLDLPSFSFYFEGGLKSLIAHYNTYQKPLHKNIFYVEKQQEDVGVEIALQYVDDLNTKIVPFANNIYNPEGGTHITGFKTALTRLINTYARKNNIIKEKDESLTGDDVLEGLTVCVSVKLREIQFEGQTKAKLGSMEAQGAVATVFGEAFATFMEEDPDAAKAIIEKSMLALRARKAAKAAKDSVLRKGVLEGFSLPGKLADCQAKDPAESEIFVVEGDSAGGSAKMGRDRRTQAILPLRGKILNIERARLDKVLASEQVRNLVVALGTAIGETFDISKLRYHKIILATDADVDGAHIRTLLLTVLYRYFKPVIEGGFVYIAQPPLYKIKQGKTVNYAYTDEHKNTILGKDAALLEVSDESGGDVSEEIEEELDEALEEKIVKGKGKKAEKELPAKAGKVSIQRYKGLGEMNPEELWETTMDPKNRVLKQVTIFDGELADRVFDMLMGTDVPARKSFIQTNAKFANLDI
jgi:DNA gyrase subunit B